MQTENVFTPVPAQIANEAIQALNFYRNQHYKAPSGSEEYELAQAINTILSEYVALRAIFENTTPLTADELRGMVDQWVWVIISSEHDGNPFRYEGWAFVATPTVVAFFDQMLLIDFYGQRFVAYRHKPKENANEEV